jgi:hypothetical protein
LQKFFWKSHTSGFRKVINIRTRNEREPGRAGMDQREKDLIRHVVSHRIQNRDIQELSDKDLATLVSDMLTEELITKTEQEK